MRIFPSVLFKGRVMVVPVLAMMLAACTNPSANATPVAIDVVVATVPIGGQPLAVVLGPDHAPWVVTGSGGSVTRIDSVTNVPGEPLAVPGFGGQLQTNLRLPRRQVS